MAKNNEKYAYLNRLSTEQLEELLRMDIEEAKPGNEDVIFHILEVIEKRENEHPTGCIPDIDQAWAEFQEYYDIPEESDASLYPLETEPNVNADDTVVLSSPHRPRLRRCLKQALVAVIAVAAVFGGMVVAQASGFDVFGTIGRWTDDVFHFAPTTNVDTERVGATMEDANSASLREALVTLGIDERLAPTWYPDGFTVSELKITNSKVSDAIYFALSDEMGRSLSVDIVRYNSTQHLSNTLFEKDGEDAEQYSNSFQTFYVLSNIDTVVATWSDDLLMEQISGEISEKELKSIIDSIGGRTN